MYGKHTVFVSVNEQVRRPDQWYRYTTLAHSAHAAMNAAQHYFHPSRLGSEGEGDSFVYYQMTDLPLGAVRVTRDDVIAAVGKEEFFGS